MIDGVGRTEKGRIALDRVSVERTASAKKVDDATSERTIPVNSLAYEMLSAVGPPVDVQKVAALRVAIAEGRYPVDPQKIAARMMELDLPTKLNA